MKLPVIDSKPGRRGFLQALGIGAGALAFHQLLPGLAFAADPPDAKRKFVFAYFEGGWDLLLGLDPRDPATTNAAQHLIDPGYNQLQYQYSYRGVQTKVTPNG